MISHQKSPVTFSYGFPTQSMTRAMAWYLSSHTCTKLNAEKRLLAAFWLSPGLTAQHFWFSLHHQYKCPKLTVSGLHLRQFIQFLWLGFCKIPSNVYSQIQKIKVDYCAFSWQISHASMFTTTMMPHRYTSLRPGPFQCLMLYRYRKKKPLPHTSKTGVPWDPATS